MRQAEIENSVLMHLYEALFADNSGMELQIIRGVGGWPENEFRRVIDYMAYQGLVRPVALGDCYTIASIGIIHAEENDLAPQDIKERNQRIRTMVLDTLARSYEESPPFAAGMHIEILSRSTGVDAMALLNNLALLKDRGYVETEAGSLFKITQYGLRAVEEWRAQCCLTEEFYQIEQMNPQQRGRAFQKLFGKIVESQSWLQNEGARTSHEEIDVLIHRKFEYFLTECKWEKDAIGANVVRELHGKLSNREGVRGIILSMSGFTRGAKKQVEDYANARIILLFGLEDFHSLLYKRCSFDTLLEEKYKQLVTFRKVVVS